MFETTRRHLFLAGFMGTGKSVIGREVAKRLNWGFIDLDEFISSIRHRSIPEIFEAEGEAAFRDHEARALRLAVISPHSVIALGGGTPMRSDSANIVRAKGRTWLLSARLNVIWSRIRHEADGRPLLAGMTTMTDLVGPSSDAFYAVAEKLLRLRQAAYARIADHVLDTSDDSIEDLAARIVNDYVLAGTRGADA